MKVTLDRTKFLEELVFVDSLVVKNTSNEKFKFIHLTNIDEKLTLMSANNGLAYAKTTVFSGVKEHFSFSVIPDKLISIIKTFTSDKISLSIHKDKFVLTSGKSNYTFKTQDFLNIFIESDGLQSSTDCNYILFKRSVEIAEDFTKVINATQFTLTSFEMRLMPTHIVTKATDGNKFANSSLEDVVEGRDMTLTIDREYVHILDKLNCSERLQIQKYQNNLIFSSGNRHVKLMSKIGTFPDTNAVIEKVIADNVLSHEVDKEVISEPLKRISMVSDEKIKKIKLVFGNGHIKLINQDNEEEIESNGTDSGEFTINAQHLIDILKHSSKMVKFYFSQLNAFALYVTDQNNTQFVAGKAS